MERIYNTLANKLAEIKNEGSYRIFTEINRIAENFPKAIHVETNKDVTMWCSNDYLGMGQDRGAIETMIYNISKFGVGAGGSRNIGGNNSIHLMLEKEMASLHNKESALIFSTGYSSNDVTLACLSRLLSDCVFISDEKNHASIINGLRQSSNAIKYIFKHNDMGHLESILKTIDSNLSKIIIFESIYSMDGDTAPIDKIVYLAQKYGALTYIDEVHAVGIYGDEGAGYANKMDLSDQIDIIQGTFAKAYGVIGGYIAGNKILIDAIRSFGSGFIFTTSLPPASVAAILYSVQHLRINSGKRDKLLQNTSILRDKMVNNRLPLMQSSNTHILPVLIGNPKLATSITRYLLDKYNIYIQAINSPTVAIGTERLRINASPCHSLADIDYLILALKESLQCHGINLK
jgi:5-aminolevulinate synthase